MLIHRSLLIIFCLCSCLISSAVPSKKEQWNQMVAQVDSWIDRLGLGIDPKIKETITVLNLLGFRTNASCEGHSDWGNAFPWISFDLESPALEAISQKRSDLLKEIHCLEQTWLQENPDSSLSVLYQDPQLNQRLTTLHQKVCALTFEIDRLQLEGLTKLQELLRIFYKSRTVDYDSVLLLSDLIYGSCRLTNHGAHWQLTRTEAVQIERLKAYQLEMEAFTEFLKDYYWSN